MLGRGLAENIQRGRMAIATAKDRGLDTAEWEVHLAELELESLLAWASELAEEGLELNQKVRYREAPLRMVNTERVSWYAGSYLQTIAYARLSQATGGWGSWTPGWCKQVEDDAVTALQGLREALASVGHREKAV